MKTHKPEKVLIALDYNPTAQKVAELGFVVAKSMNAKIVLLHVIPDLVYYFSRDYSPIMGFNGYTDAGPITSESGETLLNASTVFLDKARTHLGDPEIEIIVKQGDVSSIILDTVKDIKADCIVMGSHSHKWLEQIVSGSVSQKVLLKTTVPILQIPVTEKTENE